MRNKEDNDLGVAQPCDVRLPLISQARWPQEQVSQVTPHFKVKDKANMKTLLQLVAILALSLPAVAQAQTWVTVVASSPVPQQSMTLNVSLPVGATYRFVSLNGKATAPITTTIAQTVSSWDDGGVGRPADPDPGIAKAMQILQSSAALSVTLIDSSVNPAKTTTVKVPALPPTIYKVSCVGTGTMTGTTLTITNSTCTAVKQ